VILCENGPADRPAIFHGEHDRVVAWTAEEIVPALMLLDEARAQGFWTAGYLAYEAGLALEPRLGRLMPAATDEPLLAFGIYDAPVAANDWLADAAAKAPGVRLSPMESLVSRTKYDQAMSRIAAYIAAGDCYQVNLTFPLKTRLDQGDGPALYAALRTTQRAGHGAYCDLGVGPVIVSCSPELFFCLTAAGQISARPMKGTAPRSDDPAEDASLADALFRSEKARAENLMIVDLLRNDIGKACQIGSVRVPELYVIESFATVHQMSSSVTGQLTRPASMTGLMPALFPCGSVTGAPKIRAMEIIAELESFARGVYCGAIGWMAPDGRAAFNVAIRTLRLFPGGEILLNVGGGVVADSTAEGEWEEALWKTRFVQAVPTLS
jgi:para-aminobenzoate synthetase component 1